MYPGSRANDSIDGDLWLNLGGGISTDSVPVGSYTFSTIIHELGHALGLSHPGDYNAEPGVSITYDNSSQFLQDSNQYSVMSYFDASATGGYAPVDDTGDVSTPLLFDVYQMQKKYGINLTTRTDNTTYGFGSTAGSVYDFTTNTAPLLCIWDAGGTDTLNCSGYSENATIVLIQGTFSSIGGLIDNVSIALNTVIENAVGGSGTNLIIGNNIDNILVGGSNNDTLKGGLGNDTMIGEAGNDTYYVDSLSDVVTEAANAGTETIITTLNIYSISALTNIENLSYTGTGNTALTGNASVNILTGRTGNDTLNGDLGNDTMIGGAGNDTYYVDSLSDVVTEASNAGNDTIITTLNTYSISALTNIENLSYTGIANAALTGNASVNILTGSSGNDTLKGGLGNDILTGGTGSDYFVFKTTPHNTRNLDTITDFVHGTDKIEFSKAVFSKITTVAGTGNSNVLAANEFVSNSSATHGTTATSHVIYNTTSGVVYYDTDGNGPGAAVKVAIIGTSIHQTLAATDFFITS
jgi:Ca2+-binding RTX toxin-like protein